MAVSGASLSAGAAIVQWTFGSGKNDQWMPMSAGNGLYYFINRLSGLCLDVPGGASGTQLDQQPYTGGANQQFNLLLLNARRRRATTIFPFSQSEFANGFGRANNSFTITITTNSNFSGSVNLSVSGLPANTTSNFNPASLNGNGTSTLTITTATNTPVGVYALTITATGSDLTNTASVSLIVNSSTVGFAGNVGLDGGQRRGHQLVNAFELDEHHRRRFRPAGHEQHFDFHEHRRGSAFRADVARFRRRGSGEHQQFRGQSFSVGGLFELRQCA